MRINPRQVERIMRQMGMKMETIDAEEVIIKTPDKEIIVTNPEVAKVNVMGRDTFQISGGVSEKRVDKIKKEDVDIVVQQTGVSEEKAREMLEETGDIAEAIIKLKKP